MAVDWSIVELERNTSDGGVVTAHWNAGESETVSGVLHSGRRFGAAHFTPDASDAGFVAYASLTEEIVIGWVKTSLGSSEVTAVETSIAAEISDSKAPAQASGVPW
tara:strand:- start:215 stop:532 length:318 start_codon:yes stop_codon:yes gene_type:complete